MFAFVFSVEPRQFEIKSALSHLRRITPGQTRSHTSLYEDRLRLGLKLALASKNTNRPKAITFDGEPDESRQASWLLAICALISRDAHSVRPADPEQWARGRRAAKLARRLVRHSRSRGRLLTFALPGAVVATARAASKGPERAVLASQAARAPTPNPVIQTGRQAASKRASRAEPAGPTSRPV